MNRFYLKCILTLGFHETDRANYDILKGRTNYNKSMNIADPHIFLRKP